MSSAISLSRRENDMSDLTQSSSCGSKSASRTGFASAARAEEQILDKRRRILSFAPGSIFAFVRWTSNDFGTVISRIDILRAVAPGQRCATVPYVQARRRHPVAAVRLAQGRARVADCRCRRGARHRSGRRSPRLLASRPQPSLRQRSATARTRDRAIRPGCTGGGSRHDGLAWRHF